MGSQKWMAKAMLLGLSFFIAILLVKPIGVSTQFSVVSGIVHSSIDRDVITENATRDSGYESSNAYYDKDEGKLASSIKNPINYNLVFVLAIPLGAYIAHRIKVQSDRNKGINPTPRLSRPQPLKTYLPGFISGFLLLYGARMAGGCTSGHMMSGIMQSSISGYIFAAAVFLVAIPTAILTSRPKEV